MLFVGLFMMLLLPFLPESVASSVGGAKRWIKIAGFSIAPVEFFKIGFILFLAWTFSRKFDRKLPFKEEAKIVAPHIAALMILFFLIAFKQNDLGQIMLIGITFTLMLVSTGTSMLLFLTLGGGAILIFIVGIFSSEHRIYRIKQWLAVFHENIISAVSPALAQMLKVEDLPEPYQITHSINAIKNGGLFGEWLGNGLVKLGFLSEVHTDIILAGIAEELGLFFLFILTALILLIVQRIFKIANRSENQLYFLFCVGIAVMIAFSFIINAYGITGLTPVKGLGVPFVSYGGSSLLALAVGIGMVLSISKKANI